MEEETLYESSRNNPTKRRLREMQRTGETITTERGNTHGEFKVQAFLSRQLKQIMQNSPNWSKMSPHQQEALDMIQHKIARILAGDAYYSDHWLDIEGYAHLVYKEFQPL